MNNQKRLRRQINNNNCHDEIALRILADFSNCFSVPRVCLGTPAEHALGTPSAATQNEFASGRRGTILPRALLSEIQARSSCPRNKRQSF